MILPPNALVNTNCLRGQVQKKIPPFLKNHRFHFATSITDRYRVVKMFFLINLGEAEDQSRSWTGSKNALDKAKK